MALKQEIYERFTTLASRKQHYQEHKKEFEEIGIKLSMKEYEALADSIANTPAEDSGIVSYVGPSHNPLVPENVYLKYDKSIGVAVMYAREKKGSESLVISCYPIKQAKFERRMQKSKLGEIPKGL